ncbi:MAG: hypothetical protein FWC91_04310 [Defluviitaleaceae bacterium]|nr:hypothetical protein [Defluviitaleaceae bacterium]
MRLIKLEQLTDEMVLARTLYDGRGMLILPAGAELNAHKDQLLKFNIHYLYVEDTISKGIAMSNLFSEETKLETHETIQKHKRMYQPVDDYKKKTFFDIPYVKLAKKIAEDIYRQPQKDAYIDISELVVNQIYEFDHNLNVGIMSAVMGRVYGMNNDNIYHLCIGGFLHDIGLLALPKAVMEKFGSTTMELSDLDIYRQYPMIGYDMIKHNQAIGLISKSAVLQHKEHYDGSGFPFHKKEDEITLPAKIVAVANTFEKLLFGRDPEFGPMKIYEIIKYILQKAGTLFDPDVVAKFIRHLVIFPNGTVVNLNNGNMGIVVRQNPGKISRPIVRLIDDDFCDNFIELDLKDIADLQIEDVDVEQLR